MQLSAKVAVVLLGFLFAGCSDVAYIITDQAPFINVTCNYEMLDGVLVAAQSAAKVNGLRTKIEVHDKHSGAFSIVVWRKNFNILITGIALKKELYFIAIKRGEVNNFDRAQAKIIANSLPIRCPNL